MEEDLKRKDKKTRFDRYSFFTEMIEFYNKRLKTKHTWNFVIALFLYIAFVVTFSFNIIDYEAILGQNINIYDEVDLYLNESAPSDNAENLNVKVTRFDQVKNQFGLCIITVISGIAPYINIPVVITLIYPLITAISVSAKSKILIFIISIIVIAEIYLISLIIALGMYLCSMATKHFRYDQVSSLSFNDIKLQYNESLNNKEKVEEIKKKMERKNEKIKLLNEKTNYKAIFFFTILATVILCILTLITGV